MFVHSSRRIYCCSEAEFQKVQFTLLLYGIVQYNRTIFIVALIHEKEQLKYLRALWIILLFMRSVAKECIISFRAPWSIVLYNPTTLNYIWRWVRAALFLLFFAITARCLAFNHRSFDRMFRGRSCVNRQHFVKLIRPCDLSSIHAPLFPIRHLRCSFLSSNSNGKDVVWPVEKVRSQFVEYFVDKHHHINYKSSPCVPYNDPTLLFTNAGMNQFKPIFMGTVEPLSPLATLKRAVNSQKCIRAGGKHNDLDDVGKDTYHHTFFEMLGTWSFGDYFKKEAIEWAFDILVNVYNLDQSRLYASYFAGDPALGLPPDEEARQIWSQFLPEDRILPFDKKANFWEMGESGPCGPCTEIHYDRIGGRNAASLVNADDPDVIEIWNLVFIQFNREIDGGLRPLPNKHIDTGMGLERLTSILQNVRSNYDTDIFMPLFQAICLEIGTCPPYAGQVGIADAQQNYRDTAYRVIADHLRTLTFAITDGAIPSNEGRGYVLRRVLRRAVRYGIQTLGAKPGFLSALIPQVALHCGPAFPELIEANKIVVDLVKEEEIAFASLLERGVKYFNDIISEMKNNSISTIDGEKAFYLYDTLGFPIDLTQIMAAEHGLSVDLDGFHRAMNEQKGRSRIAANAKRLAGRDALTLGADEIAYLQHRKIKPTRDLQKYQWNQPLTTTLEAMVNKQGFIEAFPVSNDTTQLQESIGIILRETSFYSEAGGQVSDVGKLKFLTENGDVVFDVLDAQVGVYLYSDPRMTC